MKKFKLDHSTIFGSSSFLFSVHCFFVIIGSLTLWNCSSVCEVKNARQPEFETPAKTPGVKYLQFIAVGDFGTGGTGQRAVAFGMAEKARVDPVELVLLLGDNFYEDGVESVYDKQFQAKFEDMYNQPSLQVPFDAVLGNHDYRGNAEAQVEYTGLSKRWKMPARYYTFTHQVDDSTNVQFFALDTNPIAAGDPQAAEQITWLKSELEKSRARWKIVFGHHPLYSGGYHGDDPETRALRAALESIIESKIDLYLSGHDHDQQLIKPANKHVYYLISGTGSQCRDVEWKEDTIYASTNLGFAWFRLSRRELLVEFLTATGKSEYAHVVAKN
ncbi:tartrate-resistant acid phosphatase type 5 family protein [candidate division KSB1 bacterium]|nr:tartrate-resistant acid phosphatase type 5 family protein [candidate division KSB1 bacterium]